MADVHVALAGRALQDLPNYFDAMHLLGVSVLECGRFEEAKADP